MTFTATPQRGMTKMLAKGTQITELGFIALTTFFILSLFTMTIDVTV